MLRPERHTLPSCALDREQATRLREPQRLQHAGDRLGLGLGDRELVEQRHLLVDELAQQGHPGRQAHGLLGQAIAVIDRVASVGATAAATCARPQRSRASPACPLLPIKLFGAAFGLGAVAVLHGANATVGLVHDHHVVQQLLVNTGRQFVSVEIDAADRLTGLIANCDGDFGFLFGHDSGPPVSDYFVGCSFFPCFLVGRITTQPPVGPGTDPSTSSMFVSASTLNTEMFRMVTCSPP